MNMAETPGTVKQESRRHLVRFALVGNRDTARPRHAEIIRSSEVDLIEAAVAAGHAFRDNTLHERQREWIIEDRTSDGLQFCTCGGAFDDDTTTLTSTCSECGAAMLTADAAERFDTLMQYGSIFDLDGIVGACAVLIDTERPHIDGVTNYRAAYRHEGETFTRDRFSDKALAARWVIDVAHGAIVLEWCEECDATGECHAQTGGSGEAVQDHDWECEKCSAFGFIESDGESE